MSAENPASSNAPASAPQPPSAGGPRPPSAGAPPPAAPAAGKPRKWLRRVLLTVGPVAVLIGAAYFYVSTGRIVSTDNAYVKSDIGVVAAQITGPIVEVTVRENQPVAQGDVLFKVDDTPFRVALDRADAQLGAIRDYVEGIRASYRRQLAELELDKTNAAYQKREYERLRSLAEKKLASDVSVDAARNRSDVANQTLVVAQRALDQIRAQLGGDPEQPLTEMSAFLAVKSMRDTAVLDLEHTVVRAPFDGIASKVPQVGTYVAPGTPVMSVVASRDTWIEANYKETDLTHVLVGQPVTIKVDTYPEREWRGTVQSIAKATGAEFSVLPAQNATANWVKVTQRIPVRVAIDKSATDPELRVGMSTEVEIDTGWERPAPAFLTWLRPNRAEAAAPGARR